MIDTCIFGFEVIKNWFEWIDFDQKWIEDKIICVSISLCKSELNFKFVYKK